MDRRPSAIIAWAWAWAWAWAGLALAAGPAPANARTGPVELGAAVNTAGFMADPDPRYRDTLAGYDAITAETAMKIADLQPVRGRFDFTVADAMVAFAEAHGQRVFGHTLSWCTDSTMPGWLRDGSWSRTTLLSVLEQHITAVMTHFGGRVGAWDVVNEALSDDGTRRNCLWRRVIGDDWLEQAFRFARRADPGATLFYNETHADVSNAKQHATLELVRGMRERGVPVDGVGLQFHLTDRMPTRVQVEESIRRFGDIGLDVHISELDVPVWYLGSTPERKLARQAAVYGAVAAACSAQPACFRITTWGFMDRYTWRQPWEASRPLPFDGDYQPKPAWAAIQEALHPASPPPATTPPPTAPPPATPPPAPPAVVAVARHELPHPGRRPLELAANLRRQRLRTLVSRRALAVRLRLLGSQSAEARFVARVRRRVIGTGAARLTGERPRVVRVALTAAGTRRLRRSERARVVVTIVATDTDGRRAKAVSRARPG